jgi:hypothetical protein
MLAAFEQKYGSARQLVPLNWVLSFISEAFTVCRILHMPGTKACSLTVLRGFAKG